MKSVLRIPRFLTPLRTPLAARMRHATSLRTIHLLAPIWAQKDGSLKDEQIPDLEQTEEESASIPWYLRETAPLTQDQDAPRSLPQLPEDAPPELAELAKLASSDYGLSDLMVFDLRSLPAEHPHNAENEPHDFVLIATAKSEKHVFKAASELRVHLKHTERSAVIEGLVSTTPSATARRRMLRRPNKGPMSTDNDFGKSANSWVMCVVQNVQMHILTGDRRKELDLESLWSEDYVEEELEDVYPQSIRLGTWQPRRWFHTLSRLNSSSLSSCYNSLLELEVTLSDAEVQQRIDRFEQQFNRPSLQDHHTRFLFYRALHLVKPKLILFDAVTNKILAKYDDLQLVLEQPGLLETERARDMVEIMKLLVDSPEYNGAKTGVQKSTADKAYHTLSKLSKSLYRFSGIKINFGLNAEFIPLLLKLSFITKTDGVELGPRVIDDAIYNHKDFSTTTFATTIQASNRTRDVLALVDHFTRSQDQDKTLSKLIKELILFSYGNAAKWDKFWDEWEVSFNLLAPKDAAYYKNWLRLIVYLGLRNDPVGNSRFISCYWSNSASVSGSFVDFYKQNSSLFTANEKAALKSSLLRVAESVPTINKSDSVRDFVNTL